MVIVFFFSNYNIFLFPFQNTFNILLTLSLVASPILAVVTIGSKDAERREASLDSSYGPPQLSVNIPHAIYGQPATNTYPPPPPDIPPPVPQKEYGVPIQQYGPPQVQVEFGPQPGGHHEVLDNHQSNHGSSLFEQVKQHFGTPKANYGPPSAAYGPPPSFQQSHSRPKPSYGPPSQHTVYGPPKQVYKPKPSYGPPRPSNSYGPPPSQGRPSKPQQNYGPPIQTVHRPTPIYGAPAPVYRPQQTPTYQPRPPTQQYGPPPGVSLQTASAGPIPSYHANPIPNTLPTPTHCEGWRPIAGPAIPYSNSEQQIHQEHISVDNSFGAHQEQSSSFGGHQDISAAFGGQQEAASAFGTTAQDISGYSNSIQTQQQYATGFDHSGPEVAALVSQVNLGDQNSLTDGDLHLPVQNAINFYFDTAAGLNQQSGKHQSGGGSISNSIHGSLVSHGNAISHGSSSNHGSSTFGGGVSCV